MQTEPFSSGPSFFYYNQGLTLKHQKATVDKFEKARVLFTLSSKMVSEEYMSTLFNEEVIEKLKPQVVSMHGIDLPRTNALAQLSWYYSKRLCPQLCIISRANGDTPDPI